MPGELGFFALAKNVANAYVYKYIYIYFGINT